MNNRIDSIFVGRSNVLEELERYFLDTTKGRGHVVNIEGEAGIGKTYLIDHFLKYIQKNNENTIIAKGQCVEIAQDIEPFLPFKQVFIQLTNNHNLSKDGEKNKYLSAAARLAPAWLGVVPIVGSLAAAIFETAIEINKFRNKEAHEEIGQTLLSQYVAFLKQVLRENPVIIVFDDFQWADVSTTQLLKFIVQRTVELPLLIILLMRPITTTVLTEREKVLKQTLLELQYRQQLFTIKLSGIDIQSIQQLFRSEFPGAKIPDGLSELIQTQTGGNPLFVKELLKLWRQQKWFFLDKNTWRHKGEISQWPLPKTIINVFELRLLDLSRQQRDILDMASVEGLEFTLASITQALIQVFDLGKGDIQKDVRHIAELYQLIKLVEESKIYRHLLGELYQFVHGVLQKYLYENLVPEQLQKYHQAIGAALEEIFGQHLEDIAGILASHFDRGGLSEKAIHYYRIAAQTAYLRLHSFKEAKQLYQGILNVLEKNQINNLEVMGEALGGLAHSSRALGQLEQAIDLYHKAIEVNEKTGNYILNGPLYQMTGVCHRGLEQFDEALKYYDVALDIAIKTKNHRLHGNTLRDKGYVLLKLGRLEDSLYLFELSLNILTKINETAFAGMCWQGIGYIQFSQGRFTESIDSLKKALVMVHEAKHFYYEVTVLYYLSAYHVERDLVDAAQEYITRGLELATEQGFEFELAQLRRIQAKRAFKLNEYENGFEYYSESLQHAYYCNFLIVRKIQQEILKQIDALLDNGHIEYARKFCDFLIYVGKSKHFERIDSKYANYWQGIRSFVTSPSAREKLGPYLEN
jgi:predicted ATPase